MDPQLTNWDDLRVFLATARSATVAEAARRLRVDPTTVTRRMTAFEAAVGRPLFDRLRGGVLLSPAGALVREAAEQAELVVAGLERSLVDQAQAVRGTVRLAVAELLALAWVEPLQALADRHPHLDLQIRVSDDMHSLSRREADIALRVTRDPPEHLVGRRLSPFAIAVYGHADLQGAGLDAAPWVGWVDLGDDGGTIGRMRRSLGARGPFAIRVESYGLLLQHVRAGAGLTVLPCVLGDRLPALVRFSPPRRLPGPLWILTHPDLQATPRIRAVLDGLVDIVTADRHRISGGPTDAEAADVTGSG